MSDNEPVVEGDSMSPNDVTFLIECLKNAVGGSVQVNVKAVAIALNFSNHRSVANKINALNKKYGLPFGTSASVPKAADGEGSTAAAAAPNGPAPRTKVVKRRSARKPAPRKILPKPEPEPEPESDGVSDVSVPELSDVDMDTKGDNLEIIGKEAIVKGEDEEMPEAVKT